MHTFTDGNFTFWTAYYGSWAKDVRVVFRVREDTTPKQRATEKDIRGFDRLLPATEYEVEQWLAGHPTFTEV